MTYDITGPDALVLVLVGCGGLMLAVYGAVEAGYRIGRRVLAWRVRRRSATARRAQSIPFIERPIPHRERWPLVTVLGFAALVVAIWANCGGVR